MRDFIANAAGLNSVDFVQKSYLVWNHSQAIQTQKKRLGGEESFRESYISAFERDVQMV